ncbi:hypothetical protein ACOSP7_001296 [Xanthoceras sorbifolium]
MWTLLLVVRVIVLVGWLPLLGIITALFALPFVFCISIDEAFALREALHFINLLDFRISKVESNSLLAIYNINSIHSFVANGPCRIFARTCPRLVIVPLFITRQNMVIRRFNC